MKDLSKVLCLVGLLLVAGSSMASEAAAAKAGVQPAAATKAEDSKLADNSKRTRMICTTEKVTGSRFAKRVCMTEEETERMREAGKEAVERVQRMPIPVVSE